jgi:hypothetical protein
LRLWADAVAVAAVIIPRQARHAYSIQPQYWVPARWAKSSIIQSLQYSQLTFVSRRSNMSGINKFSLAGWILGISFGVATSGIAFAGSIADTYTTGDTLTATKMTAVKTAVNDNDTRVNAILAGTQTCAAGMTRVGPTCVDTVRQAAGTPWSTAVDFCRTANKRLLTPAEYVAARIQNAAGFGMDSPATDGTFEFVDSVSNDASSDGDILGGISGRLTVAFIGPSAGGAVPAGELFFSTQQPYDAGSGIIHFRCAR